jgi:hypothetical protein
MTDETIGDLPVAALDGGSAFIAGQAIETAATAIELQGRAKYVPAVKFLRELAGSLFDLSAELSRAVGAELKPLEEQDRKFDAAKKKLVN